MSALEKAVPVGTISAEQRHALISAVGESARQGVEPSESPATSPLSYSAAGDPEFLSAVLNGVRAQIAVYDRLDRLRLWNDEFAVNFESATGRVPAEGESAVEIREARLRSMGLSGEDIQEASAHIAAERARGATSMELEFNGRYMLLREERTPDGGRVVTFMDITPQKEALKEAEEAREFLQTVIDGVTAEIVYYDRDDRVRVWNRLHERRYMEATGVGVTDGNRMADLYRWRLEAAGLSAEQVETELNRRLAFHLSGSGTSYLVEAGAALLVRESRTEEGGTVVTATPVEQMRSDANEMVKQLENLRMIFDVLPWQLSYFDSRDRLQFWNAPYEENFVKTIGRLPRHGESNVSITQARIAALGWMGRRAEVELRQRIRDFEELPFLEVEVDERWVRIQRLRTPDGGSITYTIDVTEWKSGDISGQPDCDR